MRLLAYGSNSTCMLVDLFLFVVRYQVQSLTNQWIGIFISEMQSIFTNRNQHNYLDIIEIEIFKWNILKWFIMNRHTRKSILTTNTFYSVKDTKINFPDRLNISTIFQYWVWYLLLLHKRIQLWLITCQEWMWVETNWQEKYPRPNKRDVVFVVSSYVWTCEREKVTEKIRCICEMRICKSFFWPLWW